MQEIPYSLFSSDKRVIAYCRRYRKDTQHPKVSLESLDDGDQDRVVAGQPGLTAGLPGLLVCLKLHKMLARCCANF